MKAAFKVKSFAVGVLLLSAAMGSSGLGLGRAQGAVFVGKPLDVRVQLLLDATEDIQSACMGAEVFYGETPLDAARVSVVVEPATPGSPTGTSVRVTSSVLIDEPIVSINLRAGCELKSSKRYTLFPEVSTNVVEAPVAPIPQARPAIAAVALPVAAAASAKPPSVAPTAAPAATTGGMAIATPRKPKRLPSPEPALDKVAPPAAALVPAKPAKAAGKSRLKLDPLDLLIEVDPVLRASTELLTLPQENAEKRAEAAAQWRALNASPEDMLREAAQAQSMEKDLKALYAITADNQKGLMDLVAKVQRAESERYANGLVYALIALCFASLLALAWGWRRSRAAPVPSWRRGWDAGDSMLLSEINPLAQVQPAAPPVGKIADLAELDFDLGLMETPSPPPAAQAGANAVARDTGVQARQVTPLAPRSSPSLVSNPRARDRDFSASVSGALRAINSEDLLDVRHQAEFFMSLGEHQKAIDVLTTRIAQCGESSPLMCLDLLKIYHALGRESEFEFMRTEFNAWFTGHVPEFEAFGDEGRSLDHYPHILNQIVAMWPEVSVLETIENCIYHPTTDTDGPTFDLQAYRDLLLLHAIAKRIVRGSDGGGESHISELMRIPARAPAAVTQDDPELELATRGTPLGAMKVPPVLAPPPDDPTLALRAEPDRGLETDFNFLSLR